MNTFVRVILSEAKNLHEDAVFLTDSSLRSEWHWQLLPWLWTMPWCPTAWLGERKVGILHWHI